MTPSWVLLGFVIGVLFVWALPGDVKTVTPQVTGPTVVQLERPKLSDIEAVFYEWGRFAAWEHDLTEVALWDVDRKSYSICYEVQRREGAYYFRSIPHLTRPILTHGVNSPSPLVYTETEKMRSEWLHRNESLAPSMLPPVDGR
ncbi:MAG: hypothetical protein JWM32_1072 [Verrucomicrobia bacterium]|nr:hypothetical protein [Verrucomicrobiota bacterium]